MKLHKEQKLGLCLFMLNFDNRFDDEQREHCPFAPCLLTTGRELTFAFFVVIRLMQLLRGLKFAVAVNKMDKMSTMRDWQDRLDIIETRLAEIRADDDLGSMVIDHPLLISADGVLRAPLRCPSCGKCTSFTST